MYLLALSAVWLQGPSHGSPFTDAPLPFEQLKAPPDTAFDILMASLAMILLSAIAAGVFLGLSKLGAIEALLKKQSARFSGEALEREERTLSALREVGERLTREGSGSGMAAGKPEWVDPSLDRLVATLESLERSHKGGVGQLANTLAAMAAQQQAVTRALSAGPSGATGSDQGAGAGAGALTPALSTVEETLDLVSERLSRDGFSDIRIVTPSGEMDAAFLHSGQLIVEARRDGVVHKGKVSLQNGSPAAVELRPSHSIFP